MRGWRGFVSGNLVLIGLYVVVSYPSRMSAMLRDVFGGPGKTGLLQRMMSPGVAGVPKRGRGFDEYTEMGGSTELRDYIPEGDPKLPPEAGKPNVKCDSGFVAAWDRTTGGWHCIEGRHEPGGGPKPLPGGGMELDVGPPVPA